MEFRVIDNLKVIIFNYWVLVLRAMFSLNIFI
jgi:hypothetical protein